MNRFTSRRMLPAIALLGASHIASAAELLVTIEGIRSTTGNIMIQVLDQEPVEGVKTGAVAQMMLPAQVGTVKLMIPLPPARYVVRIMQDLNGNGALDENLVGLPTEPWGASNNATGRFGPPAWNDMLFELGADGAEQRIVLNH
ncbi:MAG: DUF2141 domain-containing protein [Gammaproteobacteria bacterium]|nr:DUF2141 domain-containing protein [Gammaproteobacteria bacterium]